LNFGKILLIRKNLFLCIVKAIVKKRVQIELSDRITIIWEIRLDADEMKLLF
jgi:hypothetical protein